MASAVPANPLVEIVTVGNELLLGFTLDSNSAWLGQALANLGLRVVQRTTVGDDPTAIRNAVSSALGRSGLVIVTGGLGPTNDDMTRPSVADLFQMPLEFDERVWQALLARFRRVGRTPTESNRSQAMVPRGGTVLPNQWGTAPGLWLEARGGVVVLLPGVPLEMRNLFEHEVTPRLKQWATGEVTRSATVRTTGIAESTLAEKIGALEQELAPLSLAYLPGLSGVDLRLTAWGLPAADADMRLRDGVDRLRSRAGEWVYAEGDTDLASVLIETLKARGLTMAVAESCTGGLLGGRLTSVPGSSAAFLGGIITYADAAKLHLLGVPAGILQAHGAVSVETAEWMARGAAERLGADVAVGITGIAGPGGGTPTKPVGTVCFGFSVRDVVDSQQSIFLSTREEVRARAVQSAMIGVMKRIDRR